MKNGNNIKKILPILLTILIIVLLVIGWKYWSNIVVEGFESNPIDKIGGVVYINLENREDRKKLIKEEMDKMGIPEDKIHKVSGVFIPKNGHKGCVQSHILALQMAKMNNWDTTLILEDDAELNVSEEEFKSKLSNILDFLKDKEWDVIMIGKANTVEKENHNDIIKLKSGTTSTGYIIKKHYYNKLLDLFIDCNNHMTTDKWGNTNNFEPYALDQKWSELQNKDNWYGFKTDLLKQRNIWSTINDKGGKIEGFENKKVNFNNKKNVIFTSVGDNTNFHNNWISNNQNYDIWVIYYGDNDEKYNIYKNKVKFIEKRKGSKFQNFNYVWNKYYNELNKYNYFFILDDDIIFDSYNDINRMFNLANKYDTWIIAPTFKINGSSKISHEITKTQNNNLLRFVNFIEVNVPLFNNYAINKFMKYYDDSLIGWGIDYFYVWVLGKDIKNKYILVDDIRVINPHDKEKNNTRELHNIKDVNLRAKYWNDIKEKYNIQEWVHKTHNIIKK